MARVPTLIAATLLVTPVLGQRRGFPPVPVPPGNTITAEKVQLGKALFYEEQLSSTGTMACATCHVLERGGSDPRSSAPDSIHPGRDGMFRTRDDIHGSRGVVGNERDGHYRATQYFSLGEQVTTRKAPSVINAAYARSLFWDGRASETFRDPLTNGVLLPDRGALESQSVAPPMSDVEMAHFGQSWSDVVGRLRNAKPLALAASVPASLAAFLGNRSYPELFRLAFGTSDITPARFAMAVATYERTLISNGSRVDDFLRGNQNALTPQERRGHDLFTSRRTDCVACHGGPLQTDDRFHYTGVTAQGDDLGRFNVTHDPRDRGAMRTPSVRNVGLRAPYFHDGSARTLRDVVDFYDRGGDFGAPNKDRRIRPLRLSRDEKDALVAFLQAFTDPRVAAGQAPFDRPTLYSQSPRVPRHYGAGTAGSLNIVPAFIAHEPASLGNTAMTLGIDRGHGGSPALLALDVRPSVPGVNLLGVRVHLGLSGALTVLPAIVLHGNGPGAGWGSLVLAIPNQPVLRGATVYAQWLTLDTGLRAYAATDAVALTLF